jgi:putative redox protein
MHSPRDTIVDISNASHIFVAAKHPKSFVSLDTADHLLTSKEDAEYVAEVLAAWASRYLRYPSEKAQASAATLEDQPIDPERVTRGVDSKPD